MRHIKIHNHLNGHKSVPSNPRRFGAARRDVFLGAFFGALRGLGVGLLRFSATKGAFDPRLRVITAHSLYRAVFDVSWGHDTSSDSKSRVA